MSADVEPPNSEMVQHSPFLNSQIAQQHFDCFYYSL